MPTVKADARRVPGRVAILRQRDYLIATVQGDLSDEEIVALRDDLAERVGRYRARAIIARLRGARTVVVGIQPDVAIAMVQFRIDLAPLVTALDLDEALRILDATPRRAHDG